MAEDLCEGGPDWAEMDQGCQYQKDVVVEIEKCGSYEFYLAQFLCAVEATLLGEWLEPRESCHLDDDYILLWMRPLDKCGCNGPDNHTVPAGLALRFKGYFWVKSKRSKQVQI